MSTTSTGESYDYASSSDGSDTSTSSVRPPSRRARLARSLSPKRFATRAVSRAVETRDAVVARGRVLGKETVAEAQERLENALVDVSSDATRRIINAAAGQIKGLVKNDFQPRFIHRIIDTTVDDVVPLVEREVLEGHVVPLVRRKADPSDDPAPSSFSATCPNPLLYLRAVILYTLEPFDRGIWQKLRDPLWYLLLAILAFPRFGISQGGFILLFLLSDLRDEYQLIQFILNLKALAFLGQGLIPTIVGAARLYACTYVTENTCVDDAPTVDPYEMGFYAAQIFLTLVAWFLLPFSKKKEIAYRFPRPEEVDPPTRELCGGLRYYPKRGGAIHLWMLFDFVNLLAWGFVAVYTYLEHKDDLDSETEAVEKNAEMIVYGTFYWAKAAYGICSLPWVAFKIPLVSAHLTKAKATGYDRAGKTRIMVAPRKKVEDDIEEDVKVEEQGGFRGRLRSIF